MNEDDSSQLSEPPPTPPTSSLSPALLGEEDDDELLTPASKRRKTRRKATENTTLSTPLRRSARIDKSSPLPTQSASRSRSSSRIEVVTDVVTLDPPNPSSDVGEPETTDDDADVLASRPTQRRRAKAASEDAYFEPRQGARTSGTSKKRQLNEDDWLVDDNEVEYISSDEDAPRAVPRSAKTSRKERRRRRREQDEIEADLEDLQDSDNDQNDESDESDNKRRTRGGPVTTQRDQAREHFELLKRRRAGEKIPRVLDSDDEQSQDGQDINLIGSPADDFSDQGSVHSSIDTDPEEEEARVANDGVDDFIEEDDDQDIGSSRRPQSAIPLEFTNWMSAKPRELFPHIVEWLIKNKIAPAFPRNDDIFRLAFQRVNDQVAAQAGSRLISSAWNAEFKFTILARPQIAISLIPGMDENSSCDACNKTNRPAKYDFVLSGEAYNKETLEPVERDSENEDDDADDASVDDKGHLLASQDRHFYLGTHCAANAQMGHKLTHWKYHLNETILEYLEEQGVLSADAIVSRDKKNKRKLEKEAEAILDSMEEIGKIDELWTQFQRDLKNAMLGMEDYNVKGGRLQGRIGVVRSSGTDGRTREWTFTAKGKDKYTERMTREDSPW